MRDMPRLPRPRAVSYLVVVLVLLVLGGRYLAANVGDGEDRAATEADGAALVIEAASTGSASHGALSGDAPVQELVVVHIVGAVRKPGLYRLTQGSRVADAIEKAGGAKPVAQLAAVNLAAPVADGQQIVIPGSGTGQAASPDAVPTGSAATEPAGPVPLNTATLEQLDALPGVGPVTAQRILDYRDEHGAFRSIDELDAVPGIGPARLEQLRELVAV
jgi:competence protein ComEA